MYKTNFFEFCFEKRNSTFSIKFSYFPADIWGSGGVGAGVGTGGAVCGKLAKFCGNYGGLCRIYWDK